ncbi:MAG TPA: type II secretion system F family protein [Vicinamibacterales bacterium]|nr:type II secretion system F family protein [Vicinamibacterales bacterium]
MSPDILFAVVAVFASVAFITGAVAQLTLSRRAPGRRRLEQARVTASVLSASTALTAEDSAAIKKLQSFLPKSPKDMTALRRRMTRAGIQGVTPMIAFQIARLVLPVLFGVVPLLFQPLSEAWFMMAALALLGFILPGFIVSRKTRARQRVIENGLPDALDLLIVCLEAGSSIDQGIQKVSDELSLAYPALAEELQMVITETRAGKPRLEAFKNFATRTGVDDVRALVSMLVQTDRFGTSVSQALRTHAEVSRTKRRQRAEERAAKIGVKLVFPLVFLLFPALFVVLLGPAVVKFVRVFVGEVVPQ